VEQRVGPPQAPLPVGSGGPRCGAGTDADRSGRPLAQPLDRRAGGHLVAGQQEDELVTAGAGQDVPAPQLGPAEGRITTCPAGAAAGTHTARVHDGVVDSAITAVEQFSLPG
jgi:hypothetical protein